MKPTHGTQLRHLIELLDGAVSAAYGEAGLDYRPRYTPVIRVLMAQGEANIGAIAVAAGITQPAATQTIALMVKDGLVSMKPGPSDARQKMISLTSKGKELVPRLQECWKATAVAAASLEAELPFPLGEVLDSAITALNAKPFGARIREARAAFSVSTTKKS